MTSDRTLDDVETLLAEFQRSGLRELHVRGGGVEIYLSNDPSAAGLSANAAAAPAEPRARVTIPKGEKPPATEPTAPAGGFLVRAPYRGTFYRSPKPGAKPYVEIGDVVAAESELCLVEVMKLFTAVRAPDSGRVVSIHAKDGELVAEGQPLFVLAAGS